MFHSLDSLTPPPPSKKIWVCVIGEIIAIIATCLASGASMLYWVPAGPSLTLSPRRKPRRVINVLAASSTDGGGPSSWFDSPAEAQRRKERRAGGGMKDRDGERKEREEEVCLSVMGRNTTAACFAMFTQQIQLKRDKMPSIPPSFLPNTCKY